MLTTEHGTGPQLTLPIAAASTSTVQPREPLSLRAAVRLFLGLNIAALPAVIGFDVVRAAAALHPLGLGPHPYWVPAHAGLLYILVPIVFASACVLFLTPGLIVALMAGTCDELSDWLLHGFAFSALLLGIGLSLLQAAGISPRGVAFALVAMAFSAGTFLLLAGRIANGHSVNRPATGPARLVALVVPALVLVAALTPKIFWESFNGDGAHTYESARLLLSQPLPFWDPAAGALSAWPGLSSAVFFYPLSWFMRLFGTFEASVRLPYFLFLGVLHAGIVALAAFGRDRSLGATERALVWLGLAVYTLVMAYSASYEIYAADIALPAAQSTLQIVFLIGFMLSFLRVRRAPMFLFALLTAWCSPGGALLVALWLGAVALVWRPFPLRRLVEAGAIFAAVVVLTTVIGMILGAVGQPLPGSEHGFASLAGRFRFLQLTDWRRLAFLVVPAGIAPALALVLWKRQDVVARAVTLLTLGYFGLFFIQAFVALHQFAPAMVLPLVVLWRSNRWTPRRRMPALIAIAGTGVVAFVLALPADSRLLMEARLVGSTIEDRTEGYDESRPAAMRRTAIYRSLLPLPYDPKVPLESYGGTPLVWNYYAHAPNGGPRQLPNYVLLNPLDPAPDGLALIASDAHAALYVRSDSVWQAHRALRPALSAANPLFLISKETMLGNYSQPTSGRFIDVFHLLRRLASRVGGKTQ